MIEHFNNNISLRKQCKLLNVNRSRMYYKQKDLSNFNIEIINKMTEIHKQFPFYGYRRMKVELKKSGYIINHKTIQRLMDKAGLKTLYPKKKTTKINISHKKYPYLLNNIVIKRANQAWCVDITYIKIKSGYIYLVCLIDIFSRKIMGWSLSPYLDTQFSLEALEKALQIGTPEIINSDQGCQYTSNEWISFLSKSDIKISMDGKGRWADNIYIERFWRSLKYESLYLHSIETVPEAREVLGEYIKFYNQQRPHQSLNYKTPNEVYIDSKKICQMEKVIIDYLKNKDNQLYKVTTGGIINSQKQTLFWS